MSARTIRRRFAAPFVVTLASMPACAPAPAPSNPPPPPPNAGPAPTDPAIAEPTGGPAPAEPVTAEPGAPAAAPEPTRNPPPPRQPSATTRRWTVFKTKGKAECSAVVAIDCPKPQPGKPMMTCNPPAPQPYTCPDGFADGDSLKVILRAGDTECYVDYGPMHCPPGARCNPPPPRKLPCPK